MGGVKVRKGSYKRKPPKRDTGEPERKRKYKPKICPCRHCGRTLTIRSRGLCQTCFDRPGVKENYPHLPSRFSAYLSNPGHRLTGLTDSTGAIVDDPEPTGAVPGTDEKIRVLARRASKGYSLFHPLDSIELAGNGRRGQYDEGRSRSEA